MPPRRWSPTASTDAGWTVLARNVHVGRHEIDLVAVDPGSTGRTRDRRGPLAGVAATSDCPRRPSITASACAFAPPRTACSNAAPCRMDQPVPRLPLRFDLVARSSRAAGSDTTRHAM